MSAREQLEEDRLRANLYGLLANLLNSPPADATLRLLTSARTGPDDDGPLAGCWHDLGTEAACRTPARLDDEFHRLFIGLGRGEVVPYGSWYLCGRLMDKPLAQLRTDLAKLQIERRPESRETEDHAAALCETMALISGPGTSVSRGRQRDFYLRHLASWMPRFFQDLQKAPSARFYRAVGRTGAVFLDMETACFELAEELSPAVG